MTTLANFKRRGITPFVVESLPRNDPRIPPEQRRRSPFVDQLPQCRIERGYFNQIDVPTGVTIATGHAAWYPLRRMRIRDTFAEEVALTGCAMTLLPCDSAAGALTGVTNPLAWGDTRGITAAIVVGRDLPVSVSAAGVASWSSAPAYLPGIDFGAASQSNPSKLSSVRPPDYIIVQSFPTGTFRDTAPNKPPLRWSFSPHVQRFRRGQSLDIALVVRRDFVHSLGVAGQVCGYADVALTIGLSDSAADWTV